MDKLGEINQKKFNRLFALLGEAMPEKVVVSGREWKLVKVFKHDFFAATGLYESDSAEKSVLKIFRPYSFYGIPYGLLSRWEAAHEEKVYLGLQDTGHVPKWIGRYGRTGIMHEFIPGENLSKTSKIRKDFFERLQGLIKTMHERGIAYVDTNKLENILAGDDGDCYLVDFQISWIQPPFPLSILTLPVFHVLKKGDYYHLLKNRRKVVGDVSDEEFEKARPWFIKIHRLIADPVRRRRRDYLQKAADKAPQHPEGWDSK